MAREGRPLRRSHDAYIAGVIGGLAEFFGLDPTLCRVVYAILAIPSFGTLVLAYVIMWLVIPQREEGYRY